MVQCDMSSKWALKGSDGERRHPTYTEECKVGPSVGYNSEWSD